MARAFARMARFFLWCAVALPAAHGAGALLPEDIRAAADYSTRQGGETLLVIEGDQAVFDETAKGFRRGEAHKIFSGTKGFWNLAALAAAEDGILRLDEPASDTLPEWKGDARKSRIRIRQLLDFTAGLAPAFELHGNDIPDRDVVALRQPAVADPGDAFIYGPAPIQAFHAILKRKLAPGGETPVRYLERRVLAPLGLGPQRYLADDAGSPLMATGFMLDARQWAQLGLLLLRGGAPVLTEASARQIGHGTRANAAFGLGFWNNRGAARWRARELDFEEMLEADWKDQDWSKACLSLAAPADLVASIGSCGVRLYVVPSRDLVIVRQARNARFVDAEFLRLLFGGKK